MKTRYVYFNKTTGVITGILHKRKPGRESYVKTTIDVVRPILSGEKGMLDFVVVYNRDEKKYILIERDNIIKLRYYSKSLYKIPNRNIRDYDLKIEVFNDGTILEVTLDPSRISTMYSTSMVDDVKFEKGTEIRLYIKSKDGKTLLKTIIIDAQKLLENRQLFYDISEINTKDMSFYTDRVFDNYMWVKSKVIFASPMKDMVKFEVQKADLKPRSDKFEYHLKIKEIDGALHIKNNIQDIRFVKILSDIEFFVVDKYDPTILYKKFTLSIEDLKSPTIVFDIKENMTGKTILYNHSYISVLMEGNDD
jgi:hypothetical protein